MKSSFDFFFSGYIRKVSLAGWLVGLALSPYAFTACTNSYRWETCTGTQFIPEESSIFTFSERDIETEACNSGTYWISGQDFSNYYIRTWKENPEYYVISRFNHCPNFDPDDLSTWCDEKIPGKKPVRTQ